MSAGLFTRSSAIWFGILLIAIANGAFRQAVLIPANGELAGHVISTVMLSAAVLGITVLTLRWIGPRHAAELWIIGIYWLALTAAFEFLGGHYLFGRPWETLLADYRVHEGRIWFLVLITTLVSPFIAGRFRSLQ